MKSVVFVLALLFGLTLIAPAIVDAAKDYSQMTNDQLYQMRKSGNVPPQDQSNLESEWMKRVVNMSPEERQKYQVRYSDEEIQKMRMQRQAPR
jgi:hypothetical protein